MYPEMLICVSYKVQNWF